MYSNQQITLPDFLLGEIKSRYKTSFILNASLFAISMFSTIIMTIFLVYIIVILSNELTYYSYYASDYEALTILITVTVIYLVVILVFIISKIILFILYWRFNSQINTNLNRGIYAYSGKTYYLMVSSFFIGGLLSLIVTVVQLYKVKQYYYQLNIIYNSYNNQVQYPNNINEQYNT